MALLLCWLSDPAHAQSSTNACAGIFYYGNVLTAGQWQACIASLQPALNYTPVNKAGDYMTGPLAITHINGGSGKPTVAAGTGAGTSPTVTIPNGFDSDFTLSVVTGTSPTGSNTIVGTVTFSASYVTNPPLCTLTPSSATAAALNGATQVYLNYISGPPYPSEIMYSGSSALAGSTTYTWTVHCFG